MYFGLEHTESSDSPLWRKINWVFSRQHILVILKLYNIYAVAGIPQLSQKL